MTHLFTTGYQGETIKDFIHKLIEEKIEAVIDIRENPYSRKPEFSQKPLSNILHRSGIQYLHFQELGTPTPLRSFLAAKKDYNTFFEKYKSFVPEFRESLDDLVDIGTEKKICIMCFEKDPHFCHRKIVAELLKEFSGKNIQIVHL